MGNIAKKDLFTTFLIPFILGKMALVYFGLMYSAYPGEGYGYVLCGVITFTLVMITRFLWKYRHHDGN